MSKDPIDPQVIQLYDDYCHGDINRREFFHRAGLLTVGGASALTMATALLPNYAAAETISFTDERIKATYVDYDSPGGTSGKMRGYLVQPTGEGPFPAVVVIHENRGLNPYVKDVARRFAVEGYLALAPDGLAPVGGYPGNDDDGRAMQRELEQPKLLQDMVNSANFLTEHELAGDKLGVTGFCWGGYATNYLASQLGDKMQAGVPYYGRGVTAEEVKNIKASLVVQAPEHDDRINAAWPEFEANLKANKVDYERFLYPGANHGFHNDSTPRFDEKAANLSWQRMLTHFKKHLS